MKWTTPATTKTSAPAVEGPVIIIAIAIIASTPPGAACFSGNSSSVDSSLTTTIIATTTIKKNALSLEAVLATRTVSGDLLTFCWTAHPRRRPRCPERYFIISRWGWGWGWIIATIVAGLLKTR